MSKPSFPLVGLLLDTPVRRKHTKIQNLKKIKATMRAVVSRHTEALVKVSGGAKGRAHIKAHLEYISRNGKIELETETGEKIKDRDRLYELHREWGDDLGKVRKNRRDTINIVLSMPRGTESVAVKLAARKFAKEEFSENYQYVMALHHPGNDRKTKNPHIHLTVKALGFDGQKLDPKRQDLHDWRERWAACMREQGYNVVATPRSVRGVVQKPKRHAILEAEARGKSSVKEAKLRGVAEDIAGKKGNTNPHRKAIEAEHQKVLAAWTSDAESLSKSRNQDDRELAELIREFVKEFPRVVDERDRLRGDLLSQVAKNREHDKRQKNAELEAPRKDPLGRGGDNERER